MEETLRMLEEELAQARERTASRSRVESYDLQAFDNLINAIELLAQMVEANDPEYVPRHGGNQHF